jgi:hypothetical protein
MLVRDQRNELIGGAGVGLNREKPVEGESTTNVEAVMGFDWANFAYDFPNTDVRYDSQPATEGAQKNDWGASLTLGYSF